MGCLCVLVGIGALIGHISMIVATLFLSACALIAVLYYRLDKEYRKAIRKVNEEYLKYKKMKLEKGELKRKLRNPEYEPDMGIRLLMLNPLLKKPLKIEKNFGASSKFCATPSRARRRTLQK